MIVTEDEAKELWCPLTYNAEPHQCSGSTCMAWCWSGDYSKCCDIVSRVGSSCPGCGNTVIKTGYCGMAGVHHYD